ncbi:unnamed protein product [Thelazia callipaeda]|uniref:Uncharacterized protein n=1 Tax=Thelazia callipaeda TaxID=103827 RepID=A0A0N5CJY3_THECL|nr:unnamed protein product [Thelazia callipaeda]
MREKEKKEVIGEMKEKPMKVLLIADSFESRFLPVTYNSSMVSNAF